MSKEFEYTDDYFLDRGYKKYNKTPFQSDMILYNFQKRFDDDVGKNISSMSTRQQMNG